MTFYLIFGWANIGQHLLIDPAGTLGPGRPWILLPVSVMGHNGNALVNRQMASWIANLDAWKKPRVLVYAHGGLNREVAVLQYRRRPRAIAPQLGKAIGWPDGLRTFKCARRVADFCHLQR